MGNPREDRSTAQPSFTDFVVNRLSKIRVGRRTLLVTAGTGALGVGTALVVGCGDSGKSDGSLAGAGNQGDDESQGNQQPRPDVELKPGWETFTSEKLPYQINIPPGWTLYPNEPRENSDSFRLVEADGSKSSLWILAEPVDVSTTQEYANQADPDEDTVDAGFQIEGADVYTIRGDNEILGTTYEKYVFVKDGTGWNIGMVANEETYYVDKDILLKEIVQTFRFRD